MLLRYGQIPPPLVVIICALLAWLLERISTELNLVWTGRLPVALVLALFGVALQFWAVATFRAANTTVDPRTPEKTSTLVQTGPYRWSRNPMYLGMAIVLLGLCLYLSNPLTLLTLVLYVAYITRYQILPEEKAMLKQFGTAYEAYRGMVRRWI